MKTNLKNGIPTFLLPSSGTGAATVLVLVKVGSRYETPDINGASHFIEHLMFKGTKRRPKTEDISKELDAVGADYNAYTGKDLTGYWVKVPKNTIPLAIDLLHDMITNSKFQKSEMDRERQVIMEEINMYNDNPIMHVEELLESVMFDGSTLGWEIAGDHKRMREMTRKAVIDFRNAYYTPERMVIAVSGAFPRETRSLLEKKFGSIKNGKGNDSEFGAFMPLSARKTPRVNRQFKETSQVQVALGFPAFSHSDKLAPAAKLLAIILGGSMSSRLFLSVRERRGLCYFIRASYSSYEDTGLFMIQSGLDKSRLPLAGKTIMNEIKKIKKEKVGAVELRRAKDYLAGKITLDLESSSYMAEWYARQQLFIGEALTPKQKIAKFEKVTAKQIKEVANIIFDSTKMGVAGIGTFKTDASLAKHFR